MCINSRYIFKIDDDGDNDEKFVYFDNTILGTGDMEKPTKGV